MKARIDPVQCDHSPFYPVRGLCLGFEACIDMGPRGDASLS